MNPSSGATDSQNPRLWNLNFFLAGKTGLHGRRRGLRNRPGLLDFGGYRPHRFLGTLLAASVLRPEVFAVGGILAEFLNPRLLISGCYFITLLCFIPMAFMPDIVELINFDAETEVPVGSD
jgi:hypothetical protein